MYKKIINDKGQEVQVVKRLSDGCFIPFDPTNNDYQIYLKWLDGYEWQKSTPFQGEWVKTSNGNTPEPADE
jgi:hypothetical protein